MVKYFIYLLLGFINYSYGQECTLYIEVHDSNHKPVNNLTIQIQQTDYLTDPLGRTSGIHVQLPTEQPLVSTEIRILHHGKIIDVHHVILSCEKSSIILTLPPIKIHETTDVQPTRTQNPIQDQNVKENNLEEVVIQTQSTTEKIKQQPFTVQVLSMQKEHNKTGDVGLILNRTTGIKIRTDGILGGTTQINLGGLQGKAVKFFKDGIPLELFGHAFHLGTLPTNMLERVEVYKGTLPVALATDALGGAINFVTRNPKRDMVEIASEYGSFQTLRTTANLFVLEPNNQNNYMGINASWNSSKNNYTIDAPFTDPNTSQKFTKKVKRFHDATQTLYTEICTGTQNRSWADDFKLTLLFSDFKKQIQNNAAMTQVYGQAQAAESSYSSLLNYRKSFFENRLQLNASVNYSLFHTKLTDTATVRYNWDGSVVRQKQQIGEINKGNLQNLSYKMGAFRANAAYDLGKNQTVELGYLNFYQNRTGSDPLGAQSIIHEVDVLTIPATYQKSIAALSYSKTWNNAWEALGAVKHYHYSTKGFTTDTYNFAWESQKKGDQLGYLAGIKWKNQQWIAKASYERATRLPDENEIFGDGQLVKENMDLNPERSHNLNLNVQYAFKFKRPAAVSVNFFYRKVQDIIFLQLDIPFNRYINYEASQIKGVELEFNYALKNTKIHTNATYQDIRRVDIQEPMFKQYNGSRIPNIPFLFGNIQLEHQLNSTYTQKDVWSFRWNLNYVHRFYLHALPKAQEPELFDPSPEFQTNLLIPNDGRLGQLTQDLGTYYHFSNKKYVLSLECHNIGNTRLYDNFNIQKPGRAFYLKFIYKII